MSLSFFSALESSEVFLSASAGYACLASDLSPSRIRPCCGRGSQVVQRPKPSCSHLPDRHPGWTFCQGIGEIV